MTYMKTFCKTQRKDLLLQYLCCILWFI